jgi:TolA-binding protein
MSYYFAKFHATKSLQSDRTRMHPEEIRELQIFDISEGMPDELQVEFGREANSYESKSPDDQISELTEDIAELNHAAGDLNLSLQDHLGSYSDGQSLAEIGITQPPKDSAESILQETSEEKPNLRAGEATVVRESDRTVEIQLTARYKPDNQDAYETDQWGYRESDTLPALRITNLTGTEADLIETFVPVAVDEAGGFAGFRETATKTNSLVDRLEKLTLPSVSDVEKSLRSYMQTKERAEELESKIRQIDGLIDQIVYELYDLTDDEIKIVERAVSSP